MEDFGFFATESIVPPCGCVVVVAYDANGEMVHDRECVEGCDKECFLKEYISTEFRQAYEHGGVYLLDEIDAGNPNVLPDVWLSWRK